MLRMILLLAHIFGETMSKKDNALVIFNDMSGSSRRDVIAVIVQQLGVGEAYASTLYAQAKKAATTNSTVVPQSSTPANGKITRINRSTCRMIDDAIGQALKSVETKFGVKIQVGGGTFNDTEFSTKLRISLGDVDVAKKDWERYCRSFGLKPEQFGSTFESNGTTYTVCGIKPRAKRFPVIGVNANGTRYKFPANRLPGGYAPPPRSSRGGNWF